MSFENAKAHLTRCGVANRIQVFSVSSATVELAAAAVGVEGARIAKSISFMVNGEVVLIIAAGDARVDNRKFKDKFTVKAKMLTADEAVELIGHEVGGICPFGIKDGVRVYLDNTLKRFKSVYPAVGSSNSAIELELDELFKFSNALEWVDVCKLPETVCEKSPSF